ncbi:MAG TPA: hypothetical protein DHW82_06535 [Spirochaetia bacterium]|nr:MAG: hypothetical protein A2Y41_03085 [Spirochaetes bacterium GWB1_36_13]HCL56650.1 hypothetical protein [Spirochaetia bacterium]
MKKKLTLFIFFLLFACHSYGYRLIVTPGITFINHFYIGGDHNHYAETYKAYSITASFRLNRFLMVSGGALTGSIQGIDKSVESTYDAYFPEEATRDINAFFFQPQFFFYTNPENMFYAGLGIEYIWLDTLISDKVIYEKSKKTLLVYQASIGDRFLLFPSVVFDMGVDFAFPFKKITGVLNGEGSFTNYFVNLRVGFGILF